MQLTDKIFKGLYRRGVMLEQMKEPALSRTVKQMEPVEPCENPRDIDALSPEEILRAAEEADIVDETDGRPLAEKLREAAGSGTMLLIDAIDDEPYVSSQMGPMLALRDQCAAGIKLAAKVLLNTALGFLALFLLGLTEPVTGFSLGLNFFNALTVGILGVPGLVLLVLLQMLFV